MQIRDILTELEKVTPVTFPVEYNDGKVIKFKLSSTSVTLVDGVAGDGKIHALWFDSKNKHTSLSWERRHPVKIAAEISNLLQDSKCL